MAMIYFIFQFKKLIDFLILIVFKRRKWKFKCDYLLNANGWYNYVPCTVHVRVTQNKEAKCRLLFFSKDMVDFLGKIWSLVLIEGKHTNWGKYGIYILVYIFHITLRVRYKVPFKKRKH
jgi:hypothetical protein